MALHRLLSTVLLLALVPVAGYAAVATLHSQSHAAASPSDAVNTTLSISLSGNATKIGNSTETSSASQHGAASATGSEATTQPAPQKAPVIHDVTGSIASTVVRRTNGTIIFNVTGTDLTIGSTTYTITNGSGIFNQHSLVIVVQANVTSGTTSGHLVLIGEATASLSGTGSVNVSFGDPQSKLAGSFFLSLKGMLTIAA